MDSRGLEGVILSRRRRGSGGGESRTVFRDVSFLAATKASAFFHETGAFGRGKFTRFCGRGVDVHGHGVAGVGGGGGAFGFEAISRLFYPPSILCESDCFFCPIVKSFLHIDIEGNGIRDANRDAFCEDLNSFEIIDF